MRHPLRNHFTAQDYPLGNRGLAAKKAFLYEIISQPKPHPAKIFVAAKYPFGTRVPFRNPNHHFAVAKSSKASFRSPNTLCETISQLRNAHLTHECHFAAPHSHFVAAKWAAKCHAKMPFGCENAPWLRNEPLPGKSSTVT